MVFSRQGKEWPFFDNTSDALPRDTGPLTGGLFSPVSPPAPPPSPTEEGLGSGLAAAWNLDDSRFSTTAPRVDKYGPNTLDSIDGVLSNASGIVAGLGFASDFDTGIRLTLGIHQSEMVLLQKEDRRRRQIKIP